ncbi:MAG: phage minor head protein [Sphingobium sp.]
MSGPEELPPAGVPPREAIAFFRSKGFRIGFSWEDVFRAEHARWFTIAKAMSRDVLEDIREAVDKAIGEGTTLATFKKELRPRLEAKGWWGKKTMLDPATGQHELVQLGSPRRLKTIFDTNVRTAYQAGKWERIQRTKAAFPYLEYSSVMDGRERPEHHVWHGTILPADHPWWDTHYGPCDWNCRCTAIPRSRRMLDRQGKTADDASPPPNRSYQAVNKRTGEVFTLERGIGKGWDYNVGKEYLRGLAPGPLPESFGDGAEEIGAAAQPTGAQQQLIDRFLAAFGVAPGGEAIWADRGGWPLSIGRGWFVGPAGAVRMPPGVVVDRIAAAIASADTIRWVWLRGRDGHALLFRRYARTAADITTLVDVGRDGWRWRSRTP